MLERGHGLVTSDSLKPSTYCMKHLLLTFFLLPLTCLAQNLVPNPSFEEYSECPDEPFSQFFLLEDWTNPTSSSPDYFNSCVTDNVPDGFGVPTNFFGFQEARTGNAYVGIRTMQETDVREYIQIELFNELVANQAYSVTFFVSNSENSQYASNDMGAYFSPQEVSQSSESNLPHLPQVANDPIQNELDSQSEWIEVTQTYVAAGGEKFVVIGNFNTDAQTDTVHSNQNWTQIRSYHYIDDVSVSTWNDVGFGYEHENELTVYPNPASGIVHLRGPNAYQVNAIYVVDMLGNKTPIDYQQLANVISFDVQPFEKGIYYLAIQIKDKEYLNRIMINQ